MSTLADALSGMTAKAPAPKAGVAPLKPLYGGNVACFDQTLSKTGALVLRCRPGIVMPYVSQMFRPTSDLEGNEGNFDQVEQLFEMFGYFLDQHTITLVVHEAPPVGGGRLMRPESSLMAATALRCAARERHIPRRMVSPQKVKNRFTGNPKAEKKDVKAAIERLLPEVKDLKPWNQDVSDACGAGLVIIEGER